MFRNSSSPQENGRFPVSAWWAAACTGAILIASLSPMPDWSGARQNFFASLAPGSLGAWLDVFANVVMYLPFGFCLAACGVSARRACLLGFLISTATELLQFIVPGRDPSARDILANTLGASAGPLLVATAPGRVAIRLLQKIEGELQRVRVVRTAASAWSLVWAVVVAFSILATVVLLTPAPPGGPRYFVRSPVFDPVPAPLQIGGGDSEDGVFRGAIDDVRIYDRERSAELIRADMQEPVTAARPTTGSGLVAAYSFDAGSGLLARDDSGHGHDGVISHAAWTRRGRFGGALVFDGQSSSVVVPPAPDLMLRNRVTIEAWIRPFGSPARWPAIVSHESYYLYASSNSRGYRPAAGGRFGNVDTRLRLPQALKTDEWTHLAATYDGRRINLFVNGELAATRNWWSPHQPATVSMNGIELPFGSVVSEKRLRPVLAGNLDVAAAVTCGTAQPTAAPLFFLWAPGNANALSFLSEGDDLLIRSSTIAQQLRLTSPDYRISGVFEHCSPGGQIDLALTGPLQRLHARRDGRDLPGTSPGLASGWAFFIHSELLPSWLRVGASLVWLVALSLPFGYLARGTWMSALGAAVLAAAFYVTPRLLPVDALTASQTAAMILGLMLGWIGRRAARQPVRETTFLVGVRRSEWS